MYRPSTSTATASAHARTAAGEVDGLYIAVDHDVLDAREANWALTMPEAGGLQSDLAVDVVRELAAAMPVVGYGATTMNFGVGGDAERTVDVAARLAAAAFG